MTGIKSYQELEPNNLVDNLGEFIEEALPDFPSSEEFREVLAKRRNENIYTIALLLYLMNKKDSRFTFMNENPQTGTSKVDIGVYRGAKLFYTIEAKILPTPKTGERNEYEYVYGKGGGIQRFKDRDHGVDHKGNALSKSGLIAYIEDKSYSDWLKKVNKWIDDAKWGSSEHLLNLKINVSARLNSKHKTKSNSIELDHYWIKV